MRTLVELEYLDTWEREKFTVNLRSDVPFLVHALTMWPAPLAHHHEEEILDAIEPLVDEALEEFKNRINWRLFRYDFTLDPVIH